VPTPTGLTAQAGIGISNQLSWTAVSGATGYKVEYQTGSSEWTPIQETITATSYTHSGLTEWTTYTYRIKAVMNSDESAYSAAVSRTVGPVPTGVSATAQSSSSISVSWNAVSGAISYKVYYRIGTYGALTQADLATTATSYTHTGLQANTTYWYYITALNSTRNESGYSSAVSATTSSSGSGGGTTTTKLATPTDLREFSDSQSSYVQISWAEVPLAYTYEVYRSTSANGSYSKITVSLGSGTGISSGREIATDSNPRSGTSYYKVRAIPNKTYYPNLAESDLSDYIRVDR
jgi:fibronectin type 3 domain-containing protein